MVKDGFWIGMSKLIAISLVARLLFRTTQLDARCIAQLLQSRAVFWGNPLVGVGEGHLGFASIV
eukprot:4701640-Amphidinium_carterae.1